MAISSEMNTTDTVRQRGTRRGMAFLIEALVVLAFLMLALAVFVQLFSGAQLEGLAANRLSEAVLAATNYAEEFSADPTGIDATRTQDDLTLSCTVEGVPYDEGTLYEATIVVLDEDGGELYTLETARYVGDTEVGDAA